MDNTYSASKQADSTVAMFEGLETFHFDKWCRTFGSDSKLVMHAREAPDTFSARGDWRVVSEMKTLGQIVSDMGRYGGVSGRLSGRCGRFSMEICSRVY